ncbi:host nuclease inhibitor protein [Pseudomonas sp. LMG 31766]|uniref:Host nuclease inhibitor protein n=1 Tax=Pseudomonas chaetocerotis TaxID=2758695 RepID=A0A931D0B6_9PSED|nr:host nuclease inhibitor protein [Pseudomonas chaetocerotis]MBZ9665467.1 host nuclease inhibitor protein [Pseudomonas chaetocerotis]
MAITIEQIMDQAQVYASAWSLVGGQFDQGNLLEQANLEKQVLLEMVIAFEDQAHTAGAQEAQIDLAKPLIQWHQRRIGNLGTLSQAVEGTQICLGVDDANPIVLEGAMLKGWRFALAIAEQQFEKFPLSIERTAPASDEEE